MNSLFPYQTIRKSQKEFMIDVENIIKKEKILLADVPTGIGKTAAVLSSSLNYSIENDKIVIYLTSRQSQHNIVIETLKKIKEKRKDLIVSDIISKQSMCPRMESKYNYAVFNEYCELFKRTNNCQYFLNNNAEIYEKLKNEVYGTEEAMELIKKEVLCPHKTLLEIAVISYIVVCDYNHIFSEFNKRFLKEIEREYNEIILIVDEAHNLYERIKSNLNKKLNIKTINNSIRENKEDIRLTNKLKDIKKKIKRNLEIITRDETTTTKENLKEILDIENISENIERNLKGKKNKYILKSTIKIKEFISSVENIKNDSIIIISKNNKQIEIENIDISKITKPIFENIHSGVLMSGTLKPIEMHIELLSVDKNRVIKKEYESPFPKENRKIVINTVTSTKYTNRNEKTYKIISNEIINIVKNVRKNICVFNNSYEMQYNIYKNLIGEKIKKPILLESSDLNKIQKMQIIEKMKQLKNNGGCILMGVHGGSLSEGVDYPKNLLQCIIVIGIPIPQPTIKTKELVKYYTDRYGREVANKYVYIIPAITKVKQAYGRLIRSETDKGIIVLMDSRYNNELYVNYLPEDIQIK